MASILVTGGAGYVGAHICLTLSRAGHTVVVYDNLSAGHESFVRWGPLERGDIRDHGRLLDVFGRHKPDAVVHCAASVEVGLSATDPASFYDNNTSGCLTVLRAMYEHGVRAFVLSSTCAVYGEPRTLPIDENHPQAPINAYGWSKLMAERMSRDIAAAHSGAFAHLRYFNAAGAAPEERIGESRKVETHAAPLALYALLGRRPSFSVFGRDYDTRDGSCVRDYVHVLDLADAHVAAVNALLSGGESLEVNLGAGHGVTVLELIAASERVSGRKMPVTHAPRRPGDPSALVADNTRARARLGWSPQRDINRILSDAWQWHSVIEPTLPARSSGA